MTQAFNLSQFANKLNTSGQADNTALQSGTYPISISGNAATATSATSATSATNSTTASNLAGGSAGTVPYQTASGTTAMLAAGSTGQVLTSTGTSAPVWGPTPNILNLGTSQSATSGTSIDFTGLPNNVKRIMIVFNNVSISGSSDLLLRIGAGSYLATGYNSACIRISAGTTSTTGFVLTGGANSSSYALGGIITLATVGSNLWSECGTLATSSNASYPSGGNVSLSGNLDRLRITTTSGTDTFTSGTINILYE